MLGAAIIYNPKKWLNYTEQKTKAPVISLKKAREIVCSWRLMLWLHTPAGNTKSKNIHCIIIK